MQNQYQNQNTAPAKKKSKMLIPIILLVVIIAVILIDVFVLFPNKNVKSFEVQNTKTTEITTAYNNIN